MIRKPLIAVTAVTALLFTAPALARPTGGIWEKAPRIKRVKKPKPAAEVEQVQANTAAEKPAAMAQNGTSAVVASSSDAAAAANNGEATPTVCTVEKPC